MKQLAPITGDTTLSSKYQIVIPKAVRERLQLRPGQRIELSVTPAGAITLTPAKMLSDFIGALRPTSEDPLAYQRRIRADKQYE